MNGSITTVLYDNVVAGTVVAVLVGKRTLAAFQHHSVVVHVHIAATHQHIVTSINVNGIGARSFDTLGGGIDIEVEIAHMVAFIDMVGPERTVHQPHVLHGHVATVGDIGQTRTLLVLVRTLRIPLPANPELLPIVVTFTVDGALSRNRKTIQSVGIHQRTEIRTGFSLDARLADGKVADMLRSFQLAAFLHMQMRTLFKK